MNRIKFKFSVFVIVPVLIILIVGAVALRVWIIDRQSRQIANALNHEKHTLSEGIDRNANEIAYQCVRFAALLSHSLETDLQAMGMEHMYELSGDRDRLEKLLHDRFPLVISALEWLETTSVFVILDATVNPEERGTRIGMSIENSEPYVRALRSPKLYIRGFPSIAFENGLNMRYHWRLEFNVEGHSLWEMPLQAHREYPVLPAEKLMHWSLNPSLSLHDPSVVCSIPLINSRGDALGVCGFTASTRFFKTVHTLADGEYSSFVGLLNYFPEGFIDADHPLQTISTGNQSIFRDLEAQGLPLEIVSGGNLRLDGEAALYKARDGTEYVGSQNPIRLYRKDSPFSGDTWTLTVVMPRTEYEKQIHANDMGFNIFIGVGCLIVLSLALYWLFTRKTSANEGNGLPDLDGYGLSPREKEICLLLLQGLSIKQIGYQLNISFSTANTHYHALYKKLGVSTKAELFMKFQKHLEQQ